MTHPSSVSKRGALALVGIAVIASACGTPTTSSEMFELLPQSSAHKAMQTRQFETSSSNELLSASAAALQDLGFQITESSRDVGFLKAAKERSAREYGQEITRAIVGVLTFALSVMGGSNATVILPVDLHQQIAASLIAQSVGEGSDGPRQEVRIVFYRLVWQSDGESSGNTIPPGLQRMEMIRDPLIYQQFFARLSKSVFLEAQKI